MAAEWIIGLLIFAWLFMLTRKIDRLRFRIESDRFNHSEAIRRLNDRLDGLDGWDDEADE